MHNPNRTVTDTFAAFFLLSYTKLIFVLAIPAVSISVNNINDTTLASNSIHRQLLDPSEKFLGESHYVAILATFILIFLTIILPPVVLLALYPVRLELLGHYFLNAVPVDAWLP